ncbi:putative VCBS repeat-containing protein [Beijerinckiaceae bacterium RH AL1]|nr:putative VCBS repeat-containing protein [Beijerinckiaceae bacterium RH AL1]
MVNYAYPYADDNRGRFYFDSGNAAATLENVSPAAAVYVASTVHRHPHRHVTYSLAPNVGDNNLFSIDPNTGAVHFNASPDYEHPADANHDNVYDVVVTAQFGRQVISKVVEIQVLDVNDNAPVFVSGPTASEPAHTAASTPVYVAYATDADGTSPNNTVHYSLSGTDAAQFNIDATSGAVTFKTSPSYQHPTDAGGNNVYNVVVTATDGGTPALSTSMNVAISVTDVAPPTPTDADGMANSVAEGAAAGTTTGLTVTAADGDTISYTITNDTSGGGFKIDPMTGAVTVADPTKIDYESAPGHAYSVTVQASDGTLTSQQTFSIGVTDVAPSTPVDSNAAANTVAEGAAAGTAVGVTAASTDVNGPAVTYSITGIRRAAASPSTRRPASSPSPIRPRSTTRARRGTPTASPSRRATAR